MLRPASAAYRRFLDSVDVSEQHGSLVSEIMPGQDLAVPAVGEPVAMFGTWVLDTDHGWPYHNGADYECYGGGGNGPYTQPGVTYTVTGSDLYHLDANHDGKACG